MSRDKGRTNALRLAALALGMAIFLSACGGAQRSEQPLFSDELTAPEQVNYNTVPVELGNYTAEEEGKASFLYPVENTLYWEGGEVSFVQSHVRKGDEVKAGEVLMTFAVQESAAELENLKLKLQRAQEDQQTGIAEREEAIAEAEQEMKLLASHAYLIKEQAVEKLKIDYEKYLYETGRTIASLEEQIAEMELRVTANQLIAPEDGVVMEVKSFSVGQTIRNGQELLTMYSTDVLLLKTGGASDALRYNQVVRIEAGTRDEVVTCSGRVVASPNVLPAGVKQDMTVIKLDEPLTASQLKGSLRFYAKTEEILNVLITSRDAIHKEEGKEFVYVLDGELVQKRYVETRSNSATGIAWILDGLSEGQLLVLD